MTVKLYTIFDEVAQTSGPLFQARNDGTALRNYDKVLKENNLTIDEFTLHNVGEYDPDKMNITALKPKNIIPNINMETN